jgi:starch phosphorylase
LWWNWHTEARALYRTIDTDLWEYIGHNPVRFLSEVRPAQLKDASNDPSYLQRD